MTAHNDRAKLRAEHNNPINFTCGVCCHVVPFTEGYVCTYPECPTVLAKKEEEPEVA